MAAPTYQTISSYIATSSGSYDLPKPTGTTTGDLLLFVGSQNSTSAGPNINEDGWTQLGILDPNGAGTVGGGDRYIYGKVATASEPTVYNVSGAGQWACAIIRISGARVSGSSLYRSLFPYVSGTYWIDPHVHATSGNPNPPSVNAGDSADWLSVVVAGMAGAKGGSFTAPTNYTERLDTFTNNDGPAANIGLGVYTRALSSASSEDPGALGGSTGESDVFTLLIAPADYPTWTGSFTADAVIALAPILFVCGAECQIDSLHEADDANAHWYSIGSGVGTETVTSDAAVYRSGSRSWKLTSDGTNIASLVKRVSGSWSAAYVRAYFRLPDVTPSSVVDLIELYSTSSARSTKVSLTGASTLLLTTNTVASSTNNFTPSVDTWYGVEVEVEAGVGSKWRVWNGSSWSSSESKADASLGAVDRVSFLGDDADSGWTVYFDDIAVGYSNSAGVYYDSTGTNGVSGKVLIYRPTSDGTHNYDAAGDFVTDPSDTNLGTGSTTAYTHVDAADMEQTTEYIDQGIAVAAEYLEVAFADESTGDSPRGVNLVITGKTSSLIGSGTGIKLTDGTNTTDYLSAQDWPILAQYASSFTFHYDLGGGAWSRDDVNALKARIMGAYPNRPLYGLALEVEWTGGATTVPGSFTANAVLFKNSGTKTFTADAYIVPQPGSFTADAIIKVTQSFTAAATRLNPTFHFPLGEPSGATTAADIAGGHDGTYTNDPILGVSGWAGDGTAMTSDTTGDFMQAADHVDFEWGTGDYTYVAAVKLPATWYTADWQAFFAKGPGTEYLIGTRPTEGQLGMYVIDTGYTLTPTTDLQDGWHLLMWTIDRSGNLSLFVDGGTTPESTADMSGQSAVDVSGANDFRIGTGNGATYAFGGSIQHVIGWKGTLLTGNQFAELHSYRLAFTADAVIAEATGGSGSFTADAVIKASSGTKTFTADAIVRKAIAGSFTADALVLAATEGSLTAAAIKLRTFYFGSGPDPR